MRYGLRLLLLAVVCAGRSFAATPQVPAAMAVVGAEVAVAVAAGATKTWEQA